MARGTLICQRFRKIHYLLYVDSELLIERGSFVEKELENLVSRLRARSLCMDDQGEDCRGCERLHMLCSGANAVSACRADRELMRCAMDAISQLRKERDAAIRSQTGSHRLGCYIASLTAAQNMTKEELSAVIGCTLEQTDKFLAGDLYIPFKSMDALAQRLGMTASDLLHNARV